MGRRTGYASRGIPHRSARLDDGTIAPTAAGGCHALHARNTRCRLCKPSTRRFRPHIWTAYGFRDAFNIGARVV